MDLVVNPSALTNKFSLIKPAAQLYIKRGTYTDQSSSTSKAAPVTLAGNSVKTREPTCVRKKFSGPFS